MSRMRVLVQRTRRSSPMTLTSSLSFSICYRIVVLLSSYNIQQLIVIFLYPFHLVSTTSQQAPQHHSPLPDTLSGTTRAAVLSILIYPAHTNQP